MKSTKASRILTLPDLCLTKKASPISSTVEGLAEAKNIVDCLIQTLEPRMPAAGLAAPQIGISKRVMIFSWDRSREHLHGAINPSFQPIDNQQNFGWEGCFSVPLMLAHVPRYQNIKATYMTVDGQIEAYILSGFAARVYQHECDHLDGIENIHKADAQTRKFDSHEEVISFITEVKKGDQAHYIQPRKISEEP